MHSPGLAAWPPFFGAHARQTALPAPAQIAQTLYDGGAGAELTFAPDAEEQPGTVLDFQIQAQQSGVPARAYARDLEGAARQVLETGLDKGLIVQLVRPGGMQVGRQRALLQRIIAVQACAQLTAAKRGGLCGIGQ